jgi:sugar phosphate isomerase/epimerase
MLQSPLYMKDGTGHSPRLEIQQSWWAMEGLGNGDREWSMEEKFEQIANAGFTGIVSRVPPQEEADKWRRLLDQYNFSFGTVAFPWKREDISLTIAKAKQFGAQYVNAQVMDSYVVDAEAESILGSLVEESKQQGMPLFIETHRGRMTQDLLRTVQYVKAIPDLHLTIDLSHYVVGGEMNGAMEKANPYFDVLLQRTSCIHARVSNGEQVQIDIGSEGEHPILQHYMRWWSEGMRYWLSQAKAGEVLPVLPELGPPDYAITMNSISSSRVEISDRWSQALLLKKLLEQAWQKASVQ